MVLPHIQEYLILTFLNPTPYMSACQSIPASLLHPLCTHLPLEARNAELYEYWCPNANEDSLPTRAGCFRLCGMLKRDSSSHMNSINAHARGFESFSCCRFQALKPDGFGAFSYISVTSERDCHNVSSRLLTNCCQLWLSESLKMLPIVAVSLFEFIDGRYP